MDTKKWFTKSPHFLSVLFMRENILEENKWMEHSNQEVGWFFYMCIIYLAVCNVASNQNPTLEKYTMLNKTILGLFNLIKGLFANWNSDAGHCSTKNTPWFGKLFGCFTSEAWMKCFAHLTKMARVATQR
jgi:hypothetical protein